MKDRSNVRLLSLILTGTALEWLEFIYFIQVIGIIIANFFPQNSNSNFLYLLILSSYFSRTIGSLIFGYIGDKVGRKPAMIISLILMAAASISMAILPGYQSIGNVAIALVFIIRTVQCLALPGEFTGAAIITLEEPRFKSNIFFYMSFIPFAASCGMVLGSLSSYIVNLPFMPEWAWRVPFLISGILGITAILLRFSIKETLTVNKNQSKLKSEDIKTLWLAFASVFLFGALISLWVYLGNVFFKNFYTINTGQPISDVSFVVIIGQLLATLLMPVFGKLADNKDKGVAICKLGIALACILSIPMTIASFYKSPQLWYLSQFFYALVNGMLSATLFTITFRRITKVYRFRASSISWNISGAIFGGTALYLGNQLNQAIPKFGLGLYIIAISCLTYVCFNALLKKET